MNGMVDASKDKEIAEIGLSYLFEDLKSVSLQIEETGYSIVNLSSNIAQTKLDMQEIELVVDQKIYLDGNFKNDGQRTTARTIALHSNKGYQELAERLRTMIDDKANAQVELEYLQRKFRILELKTRYLSGVKEDA